MDTQLCLTLLSQYFWTRTPNLQNPIVEVEHLCETYQQQLSDDWRMVGIGINQLHQATQNAKQWKQTKKQNKQIVAAHVAMMMMMIGQISDNFTRHI